MNNNQKIGLALELLARVGPQHEKEDLQKVIGESVRILSEPSEGEQVGGVKQFSILSPKTKNDAKKHNIGMGYNVQVIEIADGKTIARNHDNPNHRDIKGSTETFVIDPSKFDVIVS